ncbi:MAG: prepilin-type N-terminal cleavage/methylation domain-containing protein [Oscillospiraceae bacterium]|nr:prepilin-type N-terminal cleavage/methylation domain-containing protein [Oscillospiraceae bacterium]
MAYIRKYGIVKGFTLIELVVVIAIMTVLSCIIVPLLLGYVEHANNIVDAEHARMIRDMVYARHSLYGDLDCNNPHYDPNLPQTRDNYKTRGYVYVDKDEIRVSSMQIAIMLEDTGYLSNASQGRIRRQTANGTEYSYPIKEAGNNMTCFTSLRCRSSRKWDTWQVDFIMDEGGDVTFSFSARAGVNGAGGDAVATALFAQMVQGGSSTDNMDIGEQT